MFDYTKFENDIALQMEKTLKKWVEQSNDIYIFSLDCNRDMRSIGVIANTVEYLKQQTDIDSEDYWYYKYCEDEWDLFETFEESSFYMEMYIKKNKEKFTDSSTYTFTEKFDIHCDKIVESCKKALIRFAELIKEDYKNLILTFNIREYLDEEERIEIFEMINDKVVVAEYIEHINEFE